MRISWHVSAVYLACFVGGTLCHLGSTLTILWGGHRPCYPYNLCEEWGYTSDAQGAPCSGNGKYVSLAYTEFEKRDWNVSTLQGLPIGGRDITSTQVPHPGNDSICYTRFLRPVSYVWNPMLCWVRDVRYSGHKMGFQHAPPPDRLVFTSVCQYTDPLYVM
jgi:hypothetical protein